MNPLKPIVDYYRRVAEQALPGDDPYSFGADDAVRLIPDGAEHSEGELSRFVDNLFERELVRRGAVTQKCAALLSSAGIAVTLSLAALGLLLDSGSGWATAVATLLLLTVLSFMWAAVVSLVSLRLQEVVYPEDPLRLPEVLKVDEVNRAREKLLAWSKNQAVTNEIAFLYADALERYLFGLAGLVIASVGVLAIIAFD